jgi:hypothetical protein
MPDLPVRPSQPHQRDVAHYGDDTRTVFSFLGSVSRGGFWEPPAHLRAIAILGSVKVKVE